MFEISNPAGQLMELERCRDYDIDPLILHQTTPGKAPEPPAAIAAYLRD